MPHLPHLLSLLLVTVVVQTGAAGAVTADVEPATAPKVRHDFDPSTGRSLLNYPAHRLADILHEKIEISVPDMSTPHLDGVATVRFTPVAGELAVLVLDAAGLNIRAASSPGHAASAATSPGSDRLEITFDPPVAAGEVAEVRIEYQVDDPAEGITWVPESPLWPGRSASLHSQGESESNRYWFPTFDSPNERMSTEVAATVPDGFMVSSNGRLVSRERSVRPGSNGTFETFHFEQAKEHAPYLVSLAVGKWDVVDVAGAAGRVPMPVYVPVGQGGRVGAVFGRTPKMVALYERLFNEPYPWDKYAQVLCTDFAGGGMENTSATTLYDTACVDAASLLDGDKDGLISHELAHQWFGDLMTCKSWEHIWLNEGWATYCEALWEEFKGSSLGSKPGSGAGPTSGLRSDDEAYQYAIWRDFRDTMENDEADAPFQPAMVSKDYAFPDAVFDRKANPYPKGAAILHMLRRRLSEPVFWRGVSLYIDRCRNTAVETHQFRLAMEQASGTSLQRFFDQWCYRPGVPHLHLEWEWREAEHRLMLTLNQTQNIDGANPAFAVDLPVWIDDGSGSPRSIVVTTDSRTATMTIPLERRPRRVVADPEMTILADVQLGGPEAGLSETLERGPTLGARLRAAYLLRNEPGERGVEALSRVVRDGRAFFGLRVEAAGTLGYLANPAFEDDDKGGPHVKSASAVAPGPPAAGAPAALVRAAESDIADARVRLAVVEQLGRLADPAASADRKGVASILLSRWTADRSYAVRAECLRSLGRLKSVDALPAFEAGLRTESQHDQVRKGAIEGLALADFPDALDRVAPLSTPGHPPDTRAAAVRALGKLAAHDKDRVFNLLAALINDRQSRVRMAAAETLLGLDDPRAAPTVEQWTAASRSRWEKLWATDKLREKAEQAAPPEKSGG